VCGYAHSRERELFAALTRKLAHVARFTQIR
jgi:hypothetical protein